MQRLLGIFLLFLLAIGLTQPGGFMQHCNLHQMYADCSAEDHDITPLDFVFEHLLNQESVVNLLEGEYDCPMGDHPHDPFQASQATGQVMVCVAPQLNPFVIVNKTFVAALAKQYFAYNSNYFTSAFLADIFRPPIVC